MCIKPTYEELEQRIQELEQSDSGHERIEDELQRVHDNLEIKVKKRTSELNTINKELQHEITVHKQMKKVLQESEARYARVVRGTSDGLWDWNVLTNEDYLSPRWKELLGYADDELTDHYDTFFSRVHPDDTQRVKEAIQAHLEHNVPYNIEHRLRTKSGDYLWFSVRGMAERDERGQAVLMSGAITDITKRKQMEEDLLKERALLKAIIDNIPVMLTHYNPDANMLYLNKEFEKRIGWKTEEVQDIDMMEKVYPDPVYRQQAIEYMLKASLEWREFTVMSKSGEPIDSEWSNFCMEDGTQIGIGIDITERKKTENAIIKHAEIQEVLLREVNHRVKNNLSALMGMLYKEEDRAEEHGSKQDVEMLRNLVGRVKGLSVVHSLLSSSGWQPLLLTELCEKVICSALQGLSSDEKPSLDIANFPVRVSSDQAHHLTLVINELTTNSIKHALKGPDGIHIVVEFNEEGKMVQIIYRDNGPGYPQDMIERKISKTGIGFDLILGIVNESLGGNVQIDNDNGAGTTITFNVDDVKK